MEKYIIQGGNKLEGRVITSGSKNASLPIIAACLLNNDVTTLYNVPDIQDVNLMLTILEILGCKIEKEEEKLIIDSSNATGYEIPRNLMNQMRSSVMLAGAIIGRFNKAVFSYPGGCEIGARPIDLHLKGLKMLNIDIIEENGYINCQSEEIKGTEINLDFPSVGATENIMLSSVFANGSTVIKNAAREPEIIDLQNFINSMGGNIKGAGTNVILIEGVKSMHKTEYKVMPDRIEAGTLLCAGAITGGKIEVTNLNPEHLSPLVAKLKDTGCKIYVNRDIINLEVSRKRLNAIESIKTMPYPGFPTDLQSVIATILTTAKGTSVIVENIFENRYKYVNELIKMGAKITVEGRSAIIRGVKELNGAEVNATDLRGGAALVIAGLAAEGITKVNNVEHIYRGYQKIDQRLNKIGANIKVCN